MHGCPQGNVMILRANRTAARFFSYFSFRLSFFFFLPLTFVLSSLSFSFSLSPSPSSCFLFSASSYEVLPVREIKQLKSALAIRRKKQRRVSVYLRLFYRGALRYTRDLAAFPPLSLSFPREQIDASWLKFFHELRKEKKNCRRTSCRARAQFLPLQSYRAHYLQKVFYILYFFIFCYAEYRN